MDFSFDAVLFDLDGTLLATDRYWLPAARAGAAQAFTELGLERPMPSDAEWLALIGLPLDEGFARLFADVTPAQRERLMARCTEQESFALQTGQGALLPGARELLTELRVRGVRTGVASNCSRAYLDAALGKIGLEEWIEEARCLQSPACGTKADMIQDLLLTFDTRSACFVGDRAGDAAAAHANALPHVHLSGGFAPQDEQIEWEAKLSGLDLLIPRLEQRAVWIDAVLEQLGAGREGGARLIGISGPPAAGKSLFARDAQRRLRAAGMAADEVRFLVDPFLLEPTRRAPLDALIHLEIPDSLCIDRLRARHLPLAETEEFERFSTIELPRHRALAERYPPAEHADVVLDARNPLGP